MLLETARLLGSNSPAMGVDILFVDAEDWGTDGDEDSWAFGARHFVENPVGGRLSSFVGQCLIWREEPTHASP